MDIAIKGTISSQPKPSSKQAGEKRITFLLLRKSERDEISCLITLHFDASAALETGNRVILEPVMHFS
jgi:hypothetical protein